MGPLGQEEEWRTLSAIALSQLAEDASTRLPPFPRARNGARLPRSAAHPLPRKHFPEGENEVGKSSFLDILMQEGDNRAR